MPVLNQEDYNAQVAAIMRAVRDPASYKHLAASVPAYKTPADAVDPLILEYEQLDQLCAGLSRADEKLVYDAHDAAGFSAAVSTAIALKTARTVAAQVKASSSPPAVKVKQAPGMQTIEVPTDMAAEITAWRAQLGDTAFTQQLRQGRGGQGAVGSRIADDQKAAAQFKAEREMGLNPNGLRSDTGRLLGAPIRDAQGRPLKY